jgi:hypothetical protein
VLRSVDEMLHRNQLHRAYGLQLVGTARAVFVWNFYIHWWLSKFKIGRIIIQDDLNKRSPLDDRSTGIKLRHDHGPRCGGFRGPPAISIMSWTLGYRDE